MQLVYRIAADATVICHMAYALFIVLGQVAILVGIAMKWRWIRNRRFRLIHLAMILIVVAESIVGLTCPLTTLEKWFRGLAGQTSYQGDFIAALIHDFLFVSFEPWVLTACYIAFASVVVASMWLAPPLKPPPQTS